MRSYTTQFLLDQVIDEGDDDYAESYNDTAQHLVELFEEFMYGRISHDELIDYAEKTRRESMLDELKILLWENI